MCGRYSFNVKKEAIKVQLPGVSLPEGWVESLNICPSEQAFSIQREDRLKLTLMKWGFQSDSIKSKGNSLHINARSESIFEKINFKSQIINNRCIIPADSFYEWKIYGKSKMPYRILPADDSILFMAGIWKSFDSFERFVIITTHSNDDISDLHDRMPVILNTEKAREKWLSPVASKEELMEMMSPVSNGYLKNYAVSNTVNNMNVKNGDLHQKVNPPLTLF